MNAKTIEALKAIGVGFISLADSLVETPSTGVKFETIPPVTPVEYSVSNEESADKDVSSPALTKEYLDSLQYTELKTLAKELGVSGKGDRVTLTSRILNSDGDTSEEEDSSIQDSVVAPLSTSVSKNTVDTTEDSEDEDEDDAEEEDSGEDEDEDSDDDEALLVKKVNDAVAGLSDEEILEFLTDCGIRARGKRQSLISTVIKAVRDGLIQLDDEDSDESDSENESVEEPSENEVPPEYRIENESESESENEEVEVTEERRAAIEEYDEEFYSQYEDGEVSREDLVAWIQEYTEDDDEMSGKTDDEIVEIYLSLSHNLISDEGETPEEGAYTVNGNYFCCGHELDYDEKKKEFICHTCGEVYEAE